MHFIKFEAYKRIKNFIIILKRFKLTSKANVKMLTYQEPYVVIFLCSGLNIARLFFYICAYML